jgi:putative hydrolase of the HAD superfamily
MADVRAVLFDFGGTLYDYRTIAPGDQESLLRLARDLGLEVGPEALARAYRAALAATFQSYLPRPYYLHRDMFRDAVTAAMRALGAETTREALDRYRARQWQLHHRDFVLRDGVVETLQAIRDRGLHLGIVSNIDEDQLEHLGALAGLSKHFHSILSSERAGSCKPDAAIFAEALRRAGCEPAQALFVGDSIPQDIAGANRAGLRSVLLWHRPEREPPIETTRPRHVIREIPEVLGLL